VNWFKIYALLAPLQIVLAALFVVWFTRWQDAREDRRRAARDAGASRSPAE
jgi:hypothetical protein